MAMMMMTMMHAHALSHAGRWLVGWLVARSGLLYYYFHLVRRDVAWLNASEVNNEWVHHFVGLAKPWLHPQPQQPTDEAGEHQQQDSRVDAARQRLPRSGDMEMRSPAELWHAIAKSVAEDPVSCRGWVMDSRLRG